MRIFLTLTTALLLNLTVFAQTITVIPSQIEIEKVTRPGLETLLDLDKNQAKDDLKKYLKDFGKVETSDNEFIVESAEISSISTSPVKIYATIDKSKKGIKVLMAIDAGDKWITRDDAGYPQAEKILKDFGILAYTNKINEEIKEAEKALKKAEKEKEKAEKEGDKLGKDLKKNAEDKVKLEQDLVDNKEEKVKLEKDIESNKKDQSDKKEELTKTQKALDKVRAKLNNLK